eukprot:Mrub_11486.p3 GENE.Mrub_11486~~Mrub_11486.p3  ORF type:complete len:100 (+),score=4.75 Mrub_11486:50-349(+)
MNHKKNKYPYELNNKPYKSNKKSGKKKKNKEKKSKQKSTYNYEVVLFKKSCFRCQLYSYIFYLCRVKHIKLIKVKIHGKKKTFFEYVSCHFYHKNKKKT